MLPHTRGGAISFLWCVSAIEAVRPARERHGRRELTGQISRGQNDARPERKKPEQPADTEERTETSTEETGPTYTDRVAYMVIKANAEHQEALNDFKI